jgi:hypothetical protein
MGKFKENLQSVFQTLGFSEKAKKNELTDADWKTIAESYQTTYGVSLEDAIAESAKETSGAVDQAVISAEMQTQILAALNGVEEATGVEITEQAPTTVEGAVQGFVSAMNGAAAAIKILGANPENSGPAYVVSNAAANAVEFATIMGHTPHTATHLFGIDNPFFSRENWWNALTVDKKASESPRTPDQVTAFHTAFAAFSSSMKDRVNTLAENGQIAMLDYNKIIKGESYIDYSQVSTEMGARYLVRRQDAIIAYLRTLPSVANIFPVRSGVQDKEAVINAFFGEFSQSYIEGDVFKGNVTITPEIYKVDDVMFKKRFSKLKDLEKQYIGYYNREGSNPMKWNFIEWVLVNIFTVLFNEQQRRRVIGTRVPVRSNIENPSLLASDGAVTAILRLADERKILPFKESTVYDRSTIVPVFTDLWEKFMQVVPSTIGYKLHANLKHRPWFVQQFREMYGKDADFSGVANGIIDLAPDSIVWVPNMDMNDYLVWITVPGNVENYELTPGEMYAVYFEQRLESLITASWWKEGSGVQMGGLKCANDAELAKTDRKFQFIFTNYPVTELAAGATTLDGKVNTMFETQANAAATAITNIENASVERVYKIICGSLTNKTTIAKSGNFAGITAAWTPAAVGDYIKVYAELTTQDKVINGETVKVTIPTGKFLELERRVTTA